MKGPRNSAREAQLGREQKGYVDVASHHLPRENCELWCVLLPLALQ